MSAAVAESPVPARRLSLWLLAVVLAYLGLTWWFGGAETVDAALRIGQRWVLLGMILTVANFAIRALRWHTLLCAMGMRVPAGVNGVVYLAGIGLSATPGKVGETVRSAFLVRRGVPVSSSLAAFLADRLSDLHAVLWIALLPLAWAHGWDDSSVLRWAAVLVATMVAPLVLFAVVSSRHWPQLTAGLARVRAVRRPVAWLQGCAEEFTQLWRPKVIWWSVAASLAAYGLQAATFAGMVTQVAPQVLPLTCVWIFAAATLAGAASFVPGGVGTMELALVLLLRQQGVDGASALAAALCLRAVTFWFGLLLGALGLSVAGRLRVA